MGTACSRLTPSRNSSFRIEQNSQRKPLLPAELASADERYSKTTVLRSLLVHDADLGGVPIRLLSARWILEHFQAPGNEAARLEHRQALERDHPEAFVQGEMLERVLAELEERQVSEWNPDVLDCLYVAKAADGTYRPVKHEYGHGKISVEIRFPSIA